MGNSFPYLTKEMTELLAQNDQPKPGESKPDGALISTLLAALALPSRQLEGQTPNLWRNANTNTPAAATSAVFQVMHIKVAIKVLLVIEKLYMGKEYELMLTEKP